MHKITDIDQIYQSCRRDYMTGVDRSDRDYKSQEVFTPDWMVSLCLDHVPEHALPDAVCLDQAAGDGQFLSQVLIHKVVYRTGQGMPIHDSFVCSLDEIFGVDIEPDNVRLCRERLLCGCTDPMIVALVSRRILIGNCLDPYARLSGQNDQDHDLMIGYFGSKTAAFLHDLRAIAQSK